MQEQRSVRRGRARGRQPSTRAQQRLWEYQGYWLGYEEGSDAIYYYWYDEQARRTRRKSTGTRDLEEAKLKVIQLVLETPSKDPAHPDTVLLVTVRRFYMKHHGEHVRARDGIRRAFKLVSDYLKVSTGDGAPKVGQFTLARQHAFIKWCRDEHGLKAKTISTYLSYIKAAFRFAATPRVIKDASGEREVQVLSHAPYVLDSEEEISKITGLPKSEPRKWVPTDQELAAIIDEIEDEHVFRYVIMALNTWARPEAICDLDVSKQVYFTEGLVDLNPPGRPQNKKRRPLIRLTENLRGWFLYWNMARPIVFGGQPVKKIDNRTLAKAQARAGVTSGRFTKYTLRHYMATRIRKVPGIPVSREERADWMGHADPEHRQTQWYEKFDPDYLESCMRATDAILRHLNTLCKKRSLLPPNMEQVGRFTVISTEGDDVAAAKKAE